jgi:predicted transcriptional regulator
MADMELGAAQERFADLIWEREPVSSGDLVKLCEKELGWKKPTTYTVLRKLCEKGLFQNTDGVVRSRVSRAEFHAEKSERVIQDSFAGSLPSFVAAFLSRRDLTPGEAEEIQKMIDAFREEKP